MGKFLSAALAVMFAFFLITVFSTALFDASTDASKVEFIEYREYQNYSGELGEGNLSFVEEDSVSNMQTAATTIANKIADAQSQLNSDDITTQLLGAFGIISALTIDILFLLLAVMLDGVNFVGGIVHNLNSLEPPWNYFAELGGFMIAIFMVFAVFKLASAVFKWDL